MFDKERATPTDDELDNLVNLSQKVKQTQKDGSIEAEQVNKKEESKGLSTDKKRLKKMFEHYFMLAKMQGNREAKVGGTKKDKLFKLVMINTIMSTIVIVAIFATEFMF